MRVTSIASHIPEQPNLAITQNDIFVCLAQLQFEVGHFSAQLSLFLSCAYLNRLDEHQNLFCAKFRQ